MAPLRARGASPTQLRSSRAGQGFKYLGSLDLIEPAIAKGRIGVGLEGVHPLLAMLGVVFLEIVVNLFWSALRHSTSSGYRLEYS
jgi:hypothetical protein